MLINLGSSTFKDYQMKVLVVSGFLGAGKTTIIKNLVKGRTQKFCVLENEFADSGIDKTILEEQADLSVWELSSGCICCSSKAGLVSSVMAILNAVKPDVLIIETTGVGLLSNVMATLAELEHSALKLLNPIAILDARSFENHLAAKEVVFHDQVKSAGNIILSKCESLSDAAVLTLQAEIRALNAEAECTIRHYSQQSESWWQSLLQEGMTSAILPGDQAAPAWQNLSLRNVCLPYATDLLIILQQLSCGYFGDIARAKGILRCDDVFLKFDFVTDSYCITGFQGDAESNVVFIGKQVNSERLRNHFDAASIVLNSHRASVEVWT